MALASVLNYLAYCKGCIDSRVSKQCSFPIIILTTDHNCCIASEKKVPFYMCICPIRKYLGNMYRVDPLLFLRSSNGPNTLHSTQQWIFKKNSVTYTQDSFRSSTVNRYSTNRQQWLVYRHTSMEANIAFFPFSRYLIYLTLNVFFSTEALLEINPTTGLVDINIYTVINISDFHRNQYVTVSHRTPPQWQVW